MGIFFSKLLDLQDLQDDVRPTVLRPDTPRPRSPPPESPPNEICLSPSSNITINDVPIF